VFFLLAFFVDWDRAENMCTVRAARRLDGGTEGEKGLKVASEFQGKIGPQTGLLKKKIFCAFLHDFDTLMMFPSTAPTEQNSGVFLSFFQRAARFQKKFLLHQFLNHRRAQRPNFFWVGSAVIFSLGFRFPRRRTEKKKGVKRKVARTVKKNFEKICGTTYLVVRICNEKSRRSKSIQTREIANNKKTYCGPLPLHVAGSHSKHNEEI